MKRDCLIAYVRRDDSREVEADRWFTLYPLTRSEPNAFFHARLMVQHPTLTRAVYVCIGPALVLARLADRIAEDGLAWTLTWPDLQALRADSRVNVSALREAWIDERPEGDTGNRVRLFARVAGYSDDDAEG